MLLRRQIADLSHPPSSVTELKRALQEAWNRLSPQFIHSSSHSNGTTAQDGPWPSQEAFSRPAIFLPVFSNA
ncbi:hypothetical protein TNCV_1433951 [Trichonephila clavipes]|nr:hypothetical protein TNCV_1433951 [Trichonephila clavipes]